MICPHLEGVSRTLRRQLPTSPKFLSHPCWPEKGTGEEMSKYGRMRRVDQRIFTQSVSLDIGLSVSYNTLFSPWTYAPFPNLGRVRRVLGLKSVKRVLNQSVAVAGFAG